ncbi:hypothetical protein O181_063950 [Austropuccinia psidii MF-1]|uniref:Integrase catalytic domain-containing protein n=1 Tax=Austropuccinia psidii MF-1 TaxID=1389203 RepID=A0A9Q3EJN5_9BASI|nr:hypothetical protein [Austropuccinia psidii MF-1]
MGNPMVHTTSGKISIPNSLVVPSASSVLVSLGPFLNNGATLKGFKGGANLFDQNGNLILSTKIVNNVLLIDTPTSNVAFSSLANHPLILHKSLGHPNNKVASTIWPGVKFSNLNCESCVLAKLNQLPFSGTLPAPLNVLDVIHMDLCGPISPASRGAPSLSALSLLSNSKNLGENLKGRTIKTVISDNGGEFVNSKFKHLFNIKGVCHLPTEPYTPQQNPVAERGNPSLLERVWVMMLNNGVPSEWWGEASAMAMFILNRTPVSTLDFVTPLRWVSDLFTSTVPLYHPYLITSVSKILVRSIMTSQIPFKADSSAPTFSEQPNSTSSLSRGNNNSLPKGCTYDVVPVEAPQNVNSSISSSNILTGGRLRRPPSHSSGAAINKAPFFFKKPWPLLNSMHGWLPPRTNSLVLRGMGFWKKPALAYSASCLSRFLSLPSYDHELAFKHVLHYLKGTSTWGLWLGRRGDNSSIIAYCNSDWGSNYDSRSFSGSCVFQYGLVGRKATKQEVVALSSTEAEYHYISNCCQDMCWLLELVSDLALSIKANLFCDNQGALALLKNPLYQHRTRHIKLRLHWCRQLLEEGIVDVKYISTALMPADILTKSLGRIQHQEHCSSLGFSSFEHGRVLRTSC